MTDRVFAVEEGEGAGRIVYWVLKGAVDPDQLAAAWASAGLDPDDLPALPAPSTALNRAVKGLQKGRTLVRPLAGDGYAVVRETASGEALDYEATLRVRLDAVSRVTFSSDSTVACDCGWAQKTGPERAKSLHARGCRFRVASDAAGEAHPLAAQVRAAYSAALNEHESSDVASWLVRVLARRCDAVTLRDKGGVYYVPPFKMPAWLAVVGALRSVSAHKLFGIPALSNRDALEAVLDAVEREAADAADEMGAELLEAVGEGGKPRVSERVGKARVARCDEVEAKVGRYEAMLGTRLDSIRERLGDLRANLGAAMLVEAAAEPEAAA